MLIDAGGTVRYADVVRPGGIRDMGDLAKVCEDVDAAYDGACEAVPTGPGTKPNSTLFIKSHCGFSRAAVLARTNLHLADALPVHNVTQDVDAMRELERLSGGRQAPCLVQGGDVLLESTEIIARLRAQALGW